MKARWEAFAGAVLALAAAACTGGPGEAGGGGDGVGNGRAFIVIDIDTLRADHLGCYGYGRDTSPHLDAFAADGVRFAWAFSQAPYTSASQTSILTSLYPSSHGVIRGSLRLDDGVTTLAEAFRAGGYRTAAFVDGGFMSASSGLDQGFELYYDTGSKLGLEAIGPELERWLDRHGGEDFLLLVHTYDVHAPYAAPPPFTERFTAGLPPPTPGFEPNASTLRRYRLTLGGGGSGAMRPEDLAFAEARYDGGIAYVDAWLGAFFERLRARGLWRRATVAVISDHGEAFGEHGSILHEDLYTPVTRVPLLMRLPGGPRGRVVEPAVRTIDLMPTLLELAELEPVAGMQGRSLVPLLAGEDAPGALGRGVPAIAETPEFGLSRALALGRFRLVLSRRGRRAELFDYRADPRERHDLAGRHPETVAAMRAALERWQAQVAARRARPQPRVDDAETVERLRALGYIE